MKRCLWDFAVIGQIGGRAEAETINLRFSVDEPDGFKACSKQFNGPINRTQFEPGEPAKFVIGVKNIAEHLAQKGGGIGTSVKRKLVRFMLVAQGPQVVDAQNVVGVSVSVEHGVYPLDSLANSLRVEIGSGVDQNNLAAILNHYGRPSAAVVRIGGAAHRAIAANRGHAHGSAAAQHGERGFHRPMVPVAGAAGGRESAFVTSTYAMRSS